MPDPQTAPRPVNGLLALDKPKGWTSNRALQATKRLFQAEKAGHTGNLDPLATGLLLICLGQATKVSGYLLESDKRYRTTCGLGVTTTTGDAEGAILEQRDVKAIPDERLEALLPTFVGEIDQIPPMYSALKHRGKRLYELARQGQHVERQARRVSIHSLRLVARAETTMTLDIHCSKGTYIRTLIEDIGERLGCGAHVTALHRRGLGPFDQTSMLSYEALERHAGRGLTNLDAVLMPVDAALTGYPALSLTAELARYLRSSQPVLVPGAPAGEVLRLYDQHGVFFGIGRRLDDGRVGLRRFIH